MRAPPPAGSPGAAAVSDPFEGWAICEIMGHRRLAGHVTWQAMGGADFMRLDIHADSDGGPQITQFYAPGAVYCITPTTEDIARKIGARSMPVPVSRYELEPVKPREPDPWLGDEDGAEYPDEDEADE